MTCAVQSFHLTLCCQLSEHSLSTDDSYKQLSSKAQTLKYEWGRVSDKAELYFSLIKKLLISEQGKCEDFCYETIGFLKFKIIETCQGCA